MSEAPPAAGTGQDQGQVREQPARPLPVLAAVVICFVEAGFCGLGALAGIVITVLGAEAHGAGTDSGLLIAVGLLIVVVFGAAGALYVVCGRGLLGGRRRWYLAALALLGLSTAAGVVAFAALRNLWDLLWPLVDVIAIVLLAGTPRSRAAFRRPEPGAPAAGHGRG